MTVQDRFFYIVTGMSGGGKSVVSRALEDQGFHCIDNLPAPLVEPLIELTLERKRKLSRIALVCDIRGGEEFAPMLEALQKLERQGIRHQMVFLEASDEVLIRRFSETRRKHPLRRGSLQESIEAERRLVADLRGQADIILDTSAMTSGELRAELLRIVGLEGTAESFNVLLMSFGFKYGLPIEADLVLDARFLPNPHYVEHLRPMTGCSPEVREFVFGYEQSLEFLTRLTNFLDYLLPQYRQEGKAQLTVAIGCTGGRHRSVAIVEKLFAHFEENGLNVTKRHRDAERAP